MEHNRKQKLLMIIALVLAIASLSIGFAAFSMTLNISSSASVSPSKFDFKVYFTDVKDYYDDTDPTIFIDGTKINGAKEKTAAQLRWTSIEDINIQMTKPNQAVIYTFYAYNAGNYDAYLRSVNYTALDNGNYKKCTASTTDSTKATESLVQAACEGIKVTISINDTTYELGSTNIYGHKLLKGKSDKVEFKIEYIDGSSLSDGPFNVEIADIKFDYSTVDNSSSLISFSIAEISYKAEDGMTWREWVSSNYNDGTVTISDDYVRYTGSCSVYDSNGHINSDDTIINGNLYNFGYCSQ